MDFDKIKEYGNNIKMPEEMKKEILVECKANRNKEKSSKNNMLWLPKIKRTVAVACGLIFVFGIGLLYNRFFIGNNLPVDNTEIFNSTVGENRQTNMPSDSVTSTASETIASTAKEDLISETGCGYILPRKYRNNYYSIPASFIKIVGKTAFEEWEDIYLSENYPDDSNEMVMVAYVKEFNISKEDFEKANLNYAKFIQKHYSHICLYPQDYADQEMQEIYNTEIIYTFDNELINEYYLGIDYPFLNEYQYDEAIEAGTYQTRTAEFIDIEQMEAEINAKYGEPEATE